MARLGSMRESMHDARRAFWHLRHEGPDGLRRFRARERSNIERSATLCEILASCPATSLRAEIGPLRERAGGRYLRRSGLAVFATPNSRASAEQEARELARALGIEGEPVDVYAVARDGSLRGAQGPMSDAERALVLKSCEAAVLAPDVWLANELAASGTPVVDAATLPEEGRAGLERLGYLQRVRTFAGAARASVSAVVATNRPAQLEHVLSCLAGQIRRPEEILVGTHGFTAEADARVRAAELGLDVQWVPMDPAMTVGGVFAALIARARGDWIAKMDDDDFYGAEYIADALWTGERAGAALVGKNAAYTYLEAEDRTVLRFAGRELIETYHVLGPTLFTPRAVALELGYPDLARSDDTTYVQAVGKAGGRIVASARFGFAYMRHSGAHVWSDAQGIGASALPVHPGLPDWRELPFGAPGIPAVPGAAVAGEPKAGER